MVWIVADIHEYVTDVAGYLRKGTFAMTSTTTAFCDSTVKLSHTRLSIYPL